MFASTASTGAVTVVDRAYTVCLHCSGVAPPMTPPDAAQPSPAGSDSRETYRAAWAPGTGNPGAPRRGRPLRSSASPIRAGSTPAVAERTPGARSCPTSRSPSSTPAQRDERTVTTGTKAWELFADDPDGRSRPASTATLRDLAHELADGDVVEPVAIDSDDGRDILRHSTAHVLAQAVQELFPDARLGIGPPVEDGFYYDFDVESPFTPEDLDDARDRGCARSSRRASGSPAGSVTDDEARAELADEPYKLELIGLKGRGRRRRRRGRRASRSAAAS